MRWAVLALVPAICTLAASEAAAKTVEEVLKEKGVITEAEYKEVTASRLSTYAPGSGSVHRVVPEELREPPLLHRGDSFWNTLKKTGTTTFQDTSTTTPPYAGTSGWLGTNAAVFDNTEKVDVEMYSVDGAFKWRGLSVQAEYLRTNIHTQKATGSPVIDQQVRIQAQVTF